jgi:hypothetical protein
MEHMVLSLKILLMIIFIFFILSCYNSYMSQYCHKCKKRNYLSYYNDSRECLNCGQKSTLKIVYSGHKQIYDYIDDK